MGIYLKGVKMPKDREKLFKIYPNGDVVEKTSSFGVTVYANPAIELVRCKDCKWFDKRNKTDCHNPRYGDGWANYPPPCVDEDYFCKDGEKKTKKSVD